MNTQIHIRVTPEFKRALKIYCAREGITGQRWAQVTLETALGECAPDLLRNRSTRASTNGGNAKRSAGRR
jgi:hypothetical protein